MAKFTSSQTNRKADPDYPYWSYRNDAGEIVYSVPLEALEDQTAEEPVMAEEEQTYTQIRFQGGKPMRVCFVEITDRDAAYEQCTWLNTMHTRERRYSERTRLLHANENAGPGECIWDYSPKMHRNDDGFTLVDYSDLPERIEEFIRDQFPANRLYLQVYRLHITGIEPKQIGERLGIAQEMVYFYRKEALRAAQEYRKLYFDEGQYVFPCAAQKPRRKRKEEYR